MAIPILYKKLSLWLKPKKYYLWIASAFGIGLMIVPFIPLILGKKLFIGVVFFEFGAFILTIFWWLLCIESWYSDTEPGFIIKRIKSTFPKLYYFSKTFFEWYAAFFLLLFFLISLMFLSLAVGEVFA